MIEENSHEEAIVNIDAMWISSAVGVAVSVALEYMPEAWVAWFQKRQANEKRGILLAVGLLISAAVVGVSCAGWWDVVACNEDGIKSVIVAWGMFMLTNSGAYTVKKYVDK